MVRTGLEAGAGGTLLALTGAFDVPQAKPAGSLAEYTGSRASKALEILSLGPHPCSTCPPGAAKVASWTLPRRLLGSITCRARVVTWVCGGKLDVVAGSD